MIWFLCKKCGKKHSRPESEGGTMIFCACGNGVRVPFSSTAAPEPASTAPPPPAVPAPVPVPVPVPVPIPRPVPQRPPLVPEELPAPASPQASKQPAAPAARAVPVPVPVDDDDPMPTTLLPPSDPPLAYRKTHKRYRKVDPFSCWHHEEARSGGTCAACKLPFCVDCLVELNGQQLCGPCKNFRAGAAGQPVRSLPLAAIGLVCALLAGPVTFLLSLAGAGAYFSEGATRAGALLVIFSLLMPAGSLAISLLALMHLEQQPRLSGRGMASSGLCVSLACLTWGLAVLTILISR